MENIYTFALRSAVKSNSLNMEAIINMANEMDADQRDRFITAAVGIVNPDDMIAGLSPMSTADVHDEVCEFEHYNYFQDRVYYSYICHLKKYFKTAEEAEAYSTTGKERYDGNSSRNETYSFEGMWPEERHSWCSSDTWEKNAVKEEA